MFNDWLLRLRQIDGLLLPICKANYLLTDFLITGYPPRRYEPVQDK